MNPEEHPLLCRQECPREDCAWWMTNVDADLVAQRYAKHQELHARIDATKRGRHGVGS